LLCLAVTGFTQIRMTMVDPANHQIQISNYGLMEVDISTYRMCALFDYQTLNQAPITIVTGDFNLSTGESVTFIWDNIGGVGFLTDASDVGLYLPSGGFGSAANMVDFMQYGAAGQGREGVAATAGIWTAGDFVVTSSGPWMYTGDGTQNGVMFWSTLVVSVPGCMDIEACNYDMNATEDDGSCTYPGCTEIDACNFDSNAGCSDNSCVYPGCSDALACNYNAAVGCDDGSCIFPDGCVDPTACNFDSLATCDDGSCAFPDGCTDPAACNYDSLATCDNGSCLSFDACGDCGGNGIAGCTDELACNYDPSATCSDNSCIGAAGCTDVNACNYDSLAACDNGSCVAAGCSDVSACNYDSLANCDNGTCVYPGCTDLFACNYDSTAACDNGSCVAHPSSSVTIYISADADSVLYEGYLFPEAGNYFLVYPGFVGELACDSIVNVIVLDSAITGCTDITACNFNSAAGISDEALCTYPGCTDSLACNFDADAACSDLILCIVAGCTDSTACNYNPFAGCDDASCIFPDGCTDMFACNYDDQALCDNGSCTYGGCTDAAACNYDMTASCDDGSCFVAAPFLDCDGVCINDSDLDGTCDELELEGCTDSLACNYNPFVTQSDNSCLSLDACGVCGGNSVAGCTDISACNYNEAASCDDGSCLQLDDCGVCGGNGVAGCMDMNACNFNMAATCDDNSCILPDGCTDNTACNFSATAQCDNGSCTYPGCDDATACNYDAAAGCSDGSCTYTGTGTDTLIAENFDGYVSGDGVSAQSDVWDTWDGSATPDAVVVDSVSFSPSNSALISGMATDLVLPIGPFNTGRVITDFKMKLTDAGGYFNFLHNWANNNANYEWAFDVFFSGDGVVTASLGGTSVAGNDVPVGEWFDVKVIADMYMDSGWVYINNELLGNWQWSLNGNGGGPGTNQIAAIDFFGTNDAQGEGLYYIDDVQVVHSTYLDCDGNCLNDADGDGICDELEVRVNELTSMGLPVVFPNPSNGIYQVVVNNQGVITQLEVFDLMGRKVYSDKPNRSNAVVDLTSLMSGNYVLRITQDKSVKSVQLQKL